MKKIILATLFLAGLHPKAYSQPGTLDPTFGNGGKVVTDFTNTDDNGTALAIQNDNKLLVGGFTYNGNNVDMALVRYNSDGTLDMTFGTNGKVVTDIGNDDNHITALALQADGKIIAAGDADNGINKDFAVVRYNTDGTPDNTFGTNGIVTTALGSYGDLAYSVAIQNDGKIVLAGFSDTSSSNFFALVRYNTDGSLDNGFGTGGIVRTHVGQTNDQIYSVKIQADGKIVAAGYTDDGSNEIFAIARYNTDGSLDNTFGTGGIVTTSVGSSYALCQSIAIQPDGKIVATGFGTYTLSECVVARFNTDGTPDNTFGTGGIVHVPVGGINDEGDAVVIQTDGAIVVGGYAHNGANLDAMVLRLNSDGTLDNTFGNGGKVVTTFGTGNDIFLAIGTQSDHKIVAAGWTVNSARDFAIARYDAGPVGIAELSDQLTVTVNTLPDQELWLINYSIPGSSKAEISILDLSGRTVLKTKITDAHQTIVKTGTFSEGVYFIHIDTDNTSKTVKTVLAR